MKLPMPATIREIKHDLSSDIQAIMAAVKLLSKDQNLNSRSKLIVEKILEKESRISSNLDGLLEELGKSSSN